jgi:4-hydroxy-3-methylbut-2-enyl diphosphate reductase
LKLSLVALTALPALTSALGLVTPLGFVLGVIPAAMLAVVLSFDRGKLLAGARLEFLTETHFILAGVIGLIWSLATAGAV